MVHSPAWHGGGVYAAVPQRSARSPGTKLEDELRRELKLPRRAGDAIDHTGSAAADGRTGSSENLDVKHVEGFRANLNVLRFGYMEIFHEREINVTESLVSQDAHAEVSEGAVWNGKCGRIKPAPCCSNDSAVGAGPCVRDAAVVGTVAG